MKGRKIKNEEVGDDVGDDNDLEENVYENNDIGAGPSRERWSDSNSDDDTPSTFKEMWMSYLDVHATDDESDN